MGFLGHAVSRAKGWPSWPSGVPDEAPQATLATTHAILATSRLSTLPEADCSSRAPLTWPFLDSSPVFLLLPKTSRKTFTLPSLARISILITGVLNLVPYFIMMFRLILNIARRICDAHVFAAQAVAAQAC
jgi:hypothetical protein